MLEKTKNIARNQTTPRTTLLIYLTSAMITVSVFLLPICLDILDNGKLGRYC